MENLPPHILIVDDEELNLECVTEFLAETNYRISTAENGKVAMEMLEETPEDFNVILLDRMMPEMNGMDVLAKIKQHPVLQNCPVIFQTAKAGSLEIAEGIKAGAYYYLTKPFDEEVLLSVTKTAVDDHLRFLEIQKNLEQARMTMGMLKTAQFEFKSLEEARWIASLVSNACPEPSVVVMGLTELMINAIEHGNLRISYQEKTELNDCGAWKEEVSRRLQSAENVDKKVMLDFCRLNDSIQITITDDGEGFDWRKYMDFDPERVMDNHGRGIAVANKLSFSHVEYIGSGNQVCATLKLNE